MAGGIAGVGGGGMASAGGMASMGPGAVGGAGRASAPGATGAGEGGGGGASTIGPMAGVKITISAQGAKAASEPQQAGANFSVSKDGTGHQYVGGVDANGFHNPDLKATQQVNGVDSSQEMDATKLNALGQNKDDLNKLSDLVAALLLALLAQKQQEQ